MIDNPKDARMTYEDIAHELMQAHEERSRRCAVHAIYASADEYRLCGFVDSDHRDRLASFLDPDAGCYAGQTHVSHGLHIDGLRGLRAMEGIPCR